MVVDEQGRYLGKLTVDAIVTGDNRTLVKDRMEDETVVVNIATSRFDVVALFDRRETISAAVVDDFGVLAGRFTM